MTANVAIYIVIKALSQYSDKAMNKNRDPTIREDLIPPTIKPAPITKINVETTGIPR